ncbi:MAG TPA: L,D-transpeptidase [Chitinophagaceae bacterium]|nr:L,D-transpeptidase [Chitinophagaceae bacterium]
MASLKKNVSKKTDEKVLPKKVAAKKAVAKKSVNSAKSELQNDDKKEIAKPAPSKKETPPVKRAKKVVLSDDDIDIVEFDKLNNDHIPFEKLKRSRGSVALAISACPQGKQPKVIRDNPKMAPPINTANYIIQLHVTLSNQNVQITWLDGKTENWLCSPNPKLTPKLKDVVGFKCGAKHTNYKKDGMAWFTAFKSKGMAYGFHNSQRVGLGIVSHGCVRVSCEHAKIINQNSWSGKTKIKIVK